MADPEFSCPTPSAADAPAGIRQAAEQWERVALKWRFLAEQRRAHLRELFESQRWRKYRSAEAFVEELRQGTALADRWAAIAPMPEERPSAALDPLIASLAELAVVMAKAERKANASLPLADAA